MCGEESLITPHHHGDNGASQITEAKSMLAMNQSCLLTAPGRACD